MLIDLPLERVEVNPFNPRFNESSLDSLMRSLERNGQLSPVKVRKSPSNSEMYQLIFGHRRFMAARKLGWKTIRAEIVSVTDEKVAFEALVENIERKDLSDYEKALMIERIFNEFGISYAEIARRIGLSRQHVSNYVSMLHLFSAERLSSNPELLQALFSITEHHSRVLARIEDESTRMDLTLRVVKEGLTVREISNIIGRLRSWFGPSELSSSPSSLSSYRDKSESLLADEESTNSTRQTERQEEDKQSACDRKIISNLIFQLFELPHLHNYERYKRIRLFMKGFTMYSAFPPLRRLAGKQAVSREHEWFHNIAPHFFFRVQDLKVDVMTRGIALATFSVLCYNRRVPELLEMRMVATLVLKKHEEGWYIFHEHWTKVDLNSKYSSSGQKEDHLVTPRMKTD